MFEDDWDERSDEHDWEYIEMAIQEDQERQSRERFKRLPSICQRCRWMDWYYLEDCNRRLVPVNGKCEVHCRDYKFVYALPRRLCWAWWEAQYLLWALGQWARERKRRAWRLWRGE